MPGCAPLRWNFAAPGAANFHGAEPCGVEWGSSPRPRQESAMRLPRPKELALLRQAPRPRQESAMRYTPAPAPAAPPRRGGCRGRTPR